ncbi:Uncharacterized conserved protein, DUF697 family [Desulfonatronum thiosulfatophilum]|uniref:Uncharacterized conserved protein, DUF697 family n=1 Tax=Desulfonatronum thiosulfatophilum TaxID=617002 RepID=A0A1G6DQY3_9BACT|nr:GTPase [Desulfonatronum thiosulfatophilum]SDB47526.1 Uncharacterized conserved protein, DUF697 family [Desulfonatronum thiosulfatophilum]
MISNLISKLRRKLHVPIIDNGALDNGALDNALKKARETHPPPVVWLLGKTQSGKTSIIRSLTGSPDAEIGNGFQSCTRTSRFYDHPAEAPVVRFLDTQGLGEVRYDPSEDIAFAESQAHLVIAVIKVSDSLQNAVFDVLRAVRKRHPEWPVIVAQTCLHELYPPEFEHVMPYPFVKEGWERLVPTDLARALHFQRRELGRLPGNGAVFWIPVDLTLPEDDIAPADYGLNALWATIERASTMELEHRLRGDVDQADAFARAAHQQIVGYAMASATFGALPVVDLALVPALQMKMLHKLGTLANVNWDKRRVAEFMGLLGAGFLAGHGLRMVGRTMVKVVPVIGQTGGAAYGAAASAGITYALGKAGCAYLQRISKGLPVDADTVRTVFKDSLKSGKALATSFLKKDKK